MSVCSRSDNARLCVTINDSVLHCHHVVKFHSRHSVATPYTVEVFFLVSAEGFRISRLAVMEIYWPEHCSVALPPSSGNVTTAFYRLERVVQVQERVADY